MCGRASVFAAARVPVIRNSLRVSMRTSAEHTGNVRSSDQLEALVNFIQSLFGGLEQFVCGYDDAAKRKTGILHCVQDDDEK
jgi:hypothetical protein